ncbi:hypothetical protein DPEC_G00058660 [Dallia pectoralis]|uniref:Uncharacterized protein n=1 Tax=Dallia pectoralis TaxID=75939 RepID=A0ACC2H751_DALPE|nr:hypothetical protein DPEC_G00058660 [Dallia pectoralis]
MKTKKLEALNTFHLKRIDEHYGERVLLFPVVHDQLHLKMREKWLSCNAVPCDFMVSSLTVPRSPPGRPPDLHPT